MKKALIYWFSFLLILLWMTSCKSKAIVSSQTIKDSIVESVKEKIVKVAKDSSSFNAGLQVDKNGTISIKEIKSVTSGRKLQSPKVSINENILQIDCRSEAEKLLVTWKETFIKSFKENFTPVTTNVLTWWQKTRIYIGNFGMILLALFILLKLFKFNKF